MTGDQRFADQTIQVTFTAEGQPDEGPEDHNLLCWHCNYAPARYRKSSDSFAPCYHCVRERFPSSGPRRLDQPEDESYVAGMSEAAEIAGVTRQTISNWVHGYRRKNGEHSKTKLVKGTDWDFMLYDPKDPASPLVYHFARNVLEKLGEEARMNRVRLRIEEAV